jgi:tetratricopeptide (TPR) repeat protein
MRPSRANRAAGRALVALTLFFGCGVFSAAADDRKSCFVKGHVEAGSAMEEACARLIKSGKLRGKYLSSAYAHRALSLAARGEYQRALQEQNEAIRLWPDNAILRTNRATIYLKMQQYERALMDLGDSIRLDPKEADSYFWRASVYSSQHLYDRAVAESTRAIELSPKQGGYYYLRGQSYAFMREYERALEDLTRAIKLTPDNVWNYYWRGWVYLKQQLYDRAIADYTKAIRLKPDQGELYNGRCDAYLVKGEYDRALSDCNEGIQRAPKDIGFIRRCEIYVAKGELDPALRDCDDALRLEPKTISSHLWRGYIYERKGELAKAAADYREALAIDPGNRDIHIPPAIGASLDEVRAHLASLQSGTAAASAAASTPTQGDARTIMEKRGLLGVWAANCSAAVSQQNPYTVFRALDERRVQRDVMIGSTERKEAGIIETATAAGDALTYTQADETRTLRVADNRLQLVEMVRNGTTVVAGGAYLTAYGDAALTGKKTLPATKCQ